MTMKKLITLLASGALLMLISLLPVSLAEAGSKSKTVFTDLDGDGLDDNLLDIQDGFFLEDADTTAGPGVAGIGGEVFDAFSNLDLPAADLPQTNNDEFITKKFGARSVSTCRGDFDSDFGGSSGSGSSSGKVCVGGVCF
jgi:hypothetical protein